MNVKSVVVLVQPVQNTLSRTHTHTSMEIIIIIMKENTFTLHLWVCGKVKKNKQTKSIIYAKKTRNQLHLNCKCMDVKKKTIK